MAFEVLSRLANNFLQDLNGSVGLANNLNPDKSIYDNLGNKIDQSERRIYLESGTVRNLRPRSLEILMQQPDITVVIKKKIFSSLIDNYRYDLMDQNEKAFIRATKHLFQNICQRVSVYEKLSKIENIAQKQGFLDQFLLPLVLDGSDLLDKAGINLFDDQTKSVLQTLRQLNFLSETNSITTWITDKSIPYSDQLGEGTGVFELTLIEGLSTTNSIKFGEGSATLNIQDPYKLMSITEEDIEYAISQAVGNFSNSTFFKLTQSELEETIQNLQDKLRQNRQARGVSSITFLVNESAYLFKKVRAILDQEGKEIIFHFDPGVVGFGSAVVLDPSASQGRNALTISDLKIFQQIIQNIFTLLGLHQTTQEGIKQNNQSLNSLRQKMYLHYCSKRLLQIMDVVHIYLSSKTTRDAKIGLGLNSKFNPNSFLSTFNQSAEGLQNNLNNISSFFGGKESSDSFLETEKNTIVGENFPTWLWVLLRNQFTKQSAGRHIFGGVITGVSSEYNGGIHTINISLKDNTYYLDQSPVNLNPSLEVFNGSLYDCLTPFKDKFDISSGFPSDDLPELLDENLQLLQSGLLKFRDGRFRGGVASPTNYFSQAGQKADNQFQKVFYDPAGFVYRRKKGIATRVLLGQPYPSDLLKKETSPSINQNPFAGQDVMNVLSLLITGQPYNFNSFLKASLANSNLSRDDLLNQSGASSYYRGLINDLSQQNATWGNFIPFKKMIINDAAYRFLLTGQMDLSAQNQKLTELLRDRAKKFDQLTLLVPQFAGNPQFYQSGPVLTVDESNKIDTSSVARLGEDLIKLDLQIENAKQSFKNLITSPVLNQQDNLLKIFGNDISIDTSQTGEDSSVSEEDRIRNKAQFRKKINYLTQRLLFKVKANQDHNLMIVDDSYDKNYDIQAFEKGLSGKMELFQSTFSTVGREIDTIAKLLGLEVFADTQGHIQIRPPQYNKVPSSVLEKMIRQKYNTGVQLFPQYLESLFVHQFQGLTDQLEIIEDEIRLRGAAIGYLTDDDLAEFLKGSNSGNSKVDITFKFLSLDQTGRIGTQDLRSAIQQTTSDLNQAAATKSLADLRQLSNQINSISGGINFDILRRTEIVNQQSFKDLVASQGLETRFNFIADRLADKKGQTSPQLSEILGNDNLIIDQSTLLLVTDQLSIFIADRYYHLKLLTNNIKNLTDGLSLNQESSQNLQTALYPNLNSQKSFPELLEHMIEDENDDDLGIGSGKRYIIDGAQIISYRTEEEPPPYTMVEVNGLFAEGLTNDIGEFSTGSGNGLVSASGVDYDLWDQYGFRGSNPVSAPFLSNPTSQCAPFAVYLLNLVRMNLVQATVTVVGNEYLQAGEVYYLEDENLLFYAESVSHSFNYGSTFTTTLQLKYGHAPGQYLPTMLDIIGKALYNNKHNTSVTKHFRQNSADGSIPLNVLLVDTFNNSSPVSNDSSIANLLNGSNGDRNQKALANLSLILSGIISPNSQTTQPEVQIRIYKNSKDGIEISSLLQKIAQSVIQWFQNPVQSVPDRESKNKILPKASFNLPAGVDTSLFKIIELDLAIAKSSPSATAWHAAETLGLDNKITNLYKNVLDLWVVFKPVTPNNISLDANDFNQGSANNQQDQIKLQKALSLFQAKISGE